jgi:hypothetical protein
MRVRILLPALGSQRAESQFSFEAQYRFWNQGDAEHQAYAERTFLHPEKRGEKTAFS